MKKEELLKIEGMTEELAEAVAQVSAEELKGFIPKTRFDEVNEAKKNAEGLLKERDKQLEEVKKASGDNEELKKQIETLQDANKNAKADYEKAIKQMKIDNAIDKALTAAGALDNKAARALLENIDKAELNEDESEIVGLADQIKNLQESKGFLFNQKPQTTVKGATPVQNTSTTPQISEWEQKLADCRKNGDNLGAISVKRQAMEQGINLM